MFKDKIKLVIWDLDDTIWDGSLAEQDKVVPRESIISIIKKLDKIGIINSICSKNSFDDAKNKLIEIGLWDYFVFPIIDFIPKGESVKNIINSMQLQAKNVLFVDDNLGNIKEVEYYSPDIMTADANDNDFIIAINNLLNITKGSSRLSQYKILEKKNKESIKYNNNMEFLIESNIVLCIIRNPDNLIFKERIYELANRSNQLNFTISKFNSLSEYEELIGNDESIYLNHGCVFVYDKYGDYGMVGYYALDECKRQIKHFYFSCRILNMGIELAVYKYIKEKYKIYPFQPLENEISKDVSYIKIINRFDEHLKDYISKRDDSISMYKSSIIAGCSSGIIDHYLDEKFKPARCDTFYLSNDDENIKEVNYIIYTVYTDYVNSYWKTNNGFSYSKFEKSLQRFLRSNINKNIILILASEKNTEIFKMTGIFSILKYIYHVFKNIFTGYHLMRYRKCNKIVLNSTNDMTNVTVINPAKFILKNDEQIDNRHFKRIVFKRICEYISGISQNNTVTENEFMNIESAKTIIY